MRTLVMCSYAGMLLGSRAQRTVLPAILSWLDEYTQGKVA